ncbi:PAS domain S-box protein [Marivirga sp. S37H4]|uniref:histidine kinase n=1 Tax=Marivirga aurantiaca TaxID=2802615 RepID=A0A934WWD8_9BACT|nr:PAS domain S-box protein [Marivirga aurantiaca]MBK6264182.1 PAS domain S-box protein [Marivirga aurantiaca]
MDLQKYDKEQLIKEIEKLKLRLHQNKYLRKNARSQISSYSFEESIDLSMEFTAEGKLVKTNKNWRKSLGYDNSELEHVSFRDIIYHEDLALFNTAVEEVLENSHQSFVEGRLSTKAGEILYVNGIVYLNKRNNLIASFHDITHQVNAERAQSLYYNITNLTLESNDLDDLFNSIHKALNEAIDARNFFIAQFDFNKNKLIFPYIFDEHMPDSPKSLTLDHKKGLCEYIYHNKKPQILKEGQIMDLILEGHVIQYGPIPKTFLGVPFRTDKGIPGVIGIQNYQDENSFTTRDLELLNFVSAQVVLSVERKINAEKIMNQAARLQSIFDSSNHIIWSLNREYELTSFNHNFAYELLKNFGIKPREESDLPGKKIFNQLSNAQYAYWKEKFDEVLEGKSLNFEIKYKDNSNQKLIWKEIYLNPIFTENGGIKGISGIAHDITEKKITDLKIQKNETRFRRIFESFQDIYFNCRFNGEIILISPSVKDRIGYSQEDVTGNNITNYYLYTKKTKDLLKQLAAQRMVQNFEATLITSDGRLVNCICNVRLVRDKDSREVTIEGVARDITKLKQSNRELVHAKNLAENSLKVKEQFLANMSHEIRTPMNGVIGMVDLLSQTPLNPEQKGFVQTIKRSSETLLTILNDILDLSKIEAGKMTLQKNVTEMQSIFEKVLSLFHQQASSKNIHLSYKIDKEVPHFLLLDETRTIQILSNLTSNAIKFTEKDGSVILHASKELQDDVYRIAVEDTGIGISQNDQQKLFHLFSQVDNSSTKTFSGTGLGLAISKQLSQLMGGKIGVSSEPDEGSVFWFSLVAEEATKEQIAIYQQNKNKLGTAKKMHFDPKNAPYILIVDDNTINRQVASQILMKSGIKTDLATGGQAAIDKVKQNDYDLILMDIQMPTMDGITATREIKKLDKRIPPIIAMTAYSMKEDEEKFIAQGLDDYLAKPIVTDLLLAKISSHLPSFSVKEEDKSENIHNKETFSQENELIDKNILEQLRKYADSDTIYSFFEEFEIEAKGLILDSINAEKTSDIPKILSNLHTLKGNAGTLGIRSLENQARRIESDLKNKKIEDLQVNLNYLLNYFNKFTEEYQSII